MNNKLDNLIQQHGKRVMPDVSRVENARNQVHAHWVAANKKRTQQNKQRFLIKMAASLILVLSVGFMVQRTAFVEQAAIATSYFVQGDVQISNDNKTWQPLKKDQNITSGLWLKTESGLATVAFNDNSQLRIDSHSLLHFNDSEEIELQMGQIYHDADDIIQAQKLMIKTQQASIQHIGTRYAVSLDNDKLNVMVRNGQVAFESHGQHKQLAAEQQLTMDVTGQIAIKHIDAYDKSWNWTQQAIKPFNLKNKNLNQFIRWYAHEQGYTVDWNGLESKTQKVKLAGDMQGISQQDLIRTVFLSSQYNYNINSGILKILK